MAHKERHYSTASSTPSSRNSNSYNVEISRKIQIRTRAAKQRNGARDLLFSGPPSTAAGSVCGSIDFAKDYKKLKNLLEYVEKEYIDLEVLRKTMEEKLNSTIVELRRNCEVSREEKVRREKMLVCFIVALQEMRNDLDRQRSQVENLINKPLVHKVNNRDIVLNWRTRFEIEKEAKFCYDERSRELEQQRNVAEKNSQSNYCSVKIGRRMPSPTNIITKSSSRQRKRGSPNTARSDSGPTKNCKQLKDLLDVALQKCCDLEMLMKANEEELNSTIIELRRNYEAYEEGAVRIDKILVCLLVDLQRTSYDRDFEKYLVQILTKVTQNPQNYMGYERELQRVHPRLRIGSFKHKQGN